MNPGNPMAMGDNFRSPKSDWTSFRIAMMSGIAILAFAALYLSYATSQALNNLSTSVQALVAQQQRAVDERALSGMEDAFKGSALSEEEVRRITELTGKELRRLIDAKPDIQKAIEDWIKSGQAGNAPPRALLEKLKPLWEDALKLAIDTAKLPVEKAAEAKKLIETLGKEFLSGSAKSVGGKVAEDLYEYFRKLLFGKREPADGNGTCACSCTAVCPVGPPAPGAAANETATQIVVMFPWGKSSLRLESQEEQLWRAWNLYRNQPEPKRALVLRGFADTTGSASLNVKLAAARREAVVRALVDRKIPESHLLPGASPVHLPVPVPRAQAIPANRSVVIELAAKQVTP